MTVHEQVEMFSLRPFPILVLLVLLSPLVDSTCLPDGIPEERRKNLVNSAIGESYPLGMHLHGWAAAFATSAVARILLEEKFGYNVTDTGTGASTVDGIYALTGCSNPLKIGDRGCDHGGRGPTVTYSHVALESWMSTFQNVWDLIQQEYPATAPHNLGSMGYDGRVSLYISRSVRDAAWEREGLNLEFYRGYNVSWHDPAKYLDAPNSLNLSAIKPCNETRLMFSSDMKLYVELTGDWEGVHVVNKTVLGKCFDGYFWYPPSCRHDPSTCFIYITGGNGWELDTAMQKATTWNMPMATATAVDYAWFTRLPLLHDAVFFWWVPDPSFLSLSPLEVVFPPFDRQAFLQGDRRNAVTSELVEILVSQDLQTLAPYVYSFFAAWEMSLNDVNKMMEDQVKSNDDWLQVACRWLLDNEHIWQEWLPDRTKCLPQFGLYNTVTQDFVANRENPSALECRACSSGTFSSKLIDESGSTWICVPCPLGHAQASGASLACEQCSAGTYQDELGSVACKRCAIGDYQDEKGQHTCKPCPAGTVTLGLGSVIQSDCGCNAEHINMDASGFECVKCSEGLRCPIMSQLADLKSGASLLGSQFTPHIQEGYFSAVSAPTEVYRCFGSHCPGGLPGTCSGGAEGPTCDRCPAMMYMSNDICTTCGAFQAAGWITGPLIFLPVLFASYYTTETRYVVRASLFESGKLVIELMLNFVQNLGILSLVTVPWPEFLKNVFQFSTLFVLNLKSLGLNCAVNTDVDQYMFIAGVFASVLILMPCLGGLTQLVPSLKNRGWNWGYYETICTMGKIVSSLFVTMCNIGIAPFICMSHPNGQQSILKYPNTLCSSVEHSAMQWVGIFLLMLSLTHSVLCAWALYHAPTWSMASSNRLSSIGFLLANYRPSSWWFGMVLLVRGPLLSIGQVIAPSVEGAQLLMMSCVLLSSLCLQMWFLPWKVPLVNLVDAISTSLFLMLLGISLHLTPATAAHLYLDVLGTGLYYLSLGIILLVALLCFCLVAWDFCLKRTSHLRFMNLRQLPDRERMLMALEAISSKISAVKTDAQKEVLVRKMSSSLSVYDIFVVEEALELLSIDCELSPDFQYTKTRIAARRSRWSRMSRGRLEVPMAGLSKVFIDPPNATADTSETPETAELAAVARLDSNEKVDSNSVPGTETERRDCVSVLL